MVRKLIVSAALVSTLAFLLPAVASAHSHFSWGGYSYTGTTFSVGGHGVNYGRPRI